MNIPVGWFCARRAPSDLLLTMHLYVLSNLHILSKSIIDQHDILCTVSLHSLQCSLININGNPPPLGNASVWVMVLISVHLIQHQAEANGDKYNTLSHFLGRSWWAVGRLYTFWVNTGRVYSKCKYACPHADHGPWPTAVNWACVLWFGGGW